MLERYLLNIEGCIKKYADWDTAEAWLSRAQKELEKNAFKQLLDGVYSLAVLHPSNELQVEGVLALLAKFDAIGSKERRAGILLAREKLELEKRKEAERQQQARVREEQERIAEAERARLRVQRAEAAAREQERIRLKRKAEDEKERERERAQARLAEEARLRQEHIAREWLERKHAVLAAIDEQLQSDFLGAEDYFLSLPEGFISREEFEEKKRTFVKTWFAWRKEKCSDIIPPDEQQAQAIATVNGHVHVVARAGSGKTATLVYRALFLLEHCRVVPGSLMLLAFNARAALEMKVRLLMLLCHDRPERGSISDKQTEDEIDEIAGRLDVVLPHVMTFHALAYAIVHPGERLLKDDPEENLGLSQVIFEIIHNHLQIPEYKGMMRDLMLARFRTDWESLIKTRLYLSREELLRYRRSLPHESMRGEPVKSYGEKLIADFLFEHDVAYNYEKTFWWDGRPYRPDFTICKTKSSGLAIEFFGLMGNPTYDVVIQKKREYWRRRVGWELLEFSGKDLSSDGEKAFLLSLKYTLQQHGVRCNKLSEDEIWRKISHSERAIGQFKAAVVGFIGRCRKLSWSVEALRKRIDTRQDLSPIEKRFADLGHVFYAAYLERLTQTGEEDFNGLMQRAVDAVSARDVHFSRKSVSGNLSRLRYIFIDEYQDFSALFHRLLYAIGRVSPRAELFCVGDDWQAINGFAGSDLRFFQQFERFIGKHRRVDITTNYRSLKSIVDVGNALMAGCGEPARAREGMQKSSGTVLLADISTFAPSPFETRHHGYDFITPMVLRLVGAALAENADVVMLARKNLLEGKKLQAFLGKIRKMFPREFRGKIRIETTHRFKGGQGQFVIILDAVARSYPLIHPDWVFRRVFGDTLQGIVDEERRLFYVALTRAKDTLVILTEEGRCSPFLEDIQSLPTLRKLDWKAYAPVCNKLDEVMIFIRSRTYRSGAEMKEIKDLLNAAEYHWDSGLKGWVKFVAAKGFRVEALREEVWANTADGIEIRVLDESEVELALYQVNAGQWVTCVDNLAVACTHV